MCYGAVFDSPVEVAKHKLHNHNKEYIKSLEAHRQKITEKAKS